MTQSPLFIHYALISVSDKSHILEFAQSLIQKKIKLLSTEGTTQILSNAGLPTIKISDYTKLPEIMNGRLKTLHHKIYAGILHRKNIDNNILKKYNIKTIDMLIINFYPFHTIIDNQKYSKEEILEHIDIGGPNIVRAAIKNYKNIAIVTNKKDYNKIIDEINTCKGSLSLNTLFILAKKALTYILEYDKIIHNYFHQTLNISYQSHDTNNQTNQQSIENNFPNTLNLINLKFTKKQNIIYGENPHQKAALYIETNSKNTGSVATAQQLQGKTLSYNNIVDMDTALECVKMFTEPSCVIVKHNTPCGVASSQNIFTAYHQAYQADPTSAFGGIIAFNYPLDKKTTQAIINQQFVEAIIAPSIHQDCLKILSYKKDIRILICGSWITTQIPKIDFKRINGGLLIQDYDHMKNSENLQVVTICKPTNQEIKDALFCWKIVKFVKSNAIVCGKNNQTTGIGSGQMNRVYAVKIAVSSFKKENYLNIQGSVMASDAFFTFPDGIHIAVKMGIRCIIQPGGSIKDQEIINTANQHGISMIFTHIRHFRH